jgi:4-amino-4-deoxy-L-arabinose transferase-like glycosyltransferase
MVFALPLYVSTLPTFRIGTWTDDGFYFVLSRSLAQGEGMRLIHLPGAPLTAVVPPGYPLVLSPFAALCPDSLLPMRLLSIAFTVATIYLVYRYASRQLSLVMALLFVVLYAFNPQTVSASTWVMSEPTFVFVVWLALLAVERFVAHPNPPLRSLLLAALATSAMVITRYLGLPLVIAAAGYALFRRRDKQAVCYAISVLLIVVAVTVVFGGGAAWERYSSRGMALLSGATSTSAGSGTAPTLPKDEPGILQAVGRDSIHLVTDALPSSIIPLFKGPRISELFETLEMPFVPTLAQVLITVVVLLGYVYRAARRVSAMEFFFLVYCLFLLSMTDGRWQDSGSSHRYFFPMIPFALVYSLEALWRFAGWLQNRWAPLARRSLAATIRFVIPALVLLLYFARDVQAIVEPVRDRIPDVSLGATWLDENLPPDAVVMVEIPRSSYIYARRTMVPYPDGSYEAHILYGDAALCASVTCVTDAIDEFEVGYILVGPALRADQPFQWSKRVQSTLLPAIQSDPGRYPLVWASDDQLTRVYRVEP